MTITLTTRSADFETCDDAGSCGNDSGELTDRSINVDLAIVDARTMADASHSNRSEAIASMTR